MFNFLRRVVKIGLIGAALVVLAANEDVQERFKGLIDPTEPLQLSQRSRCGESRPSSELGFTASTGG